MGRHKKNQEPEKEVEDVSMSVIHGDVKRGVAAIILFLFAALFVLGFLSDMKVLDAGPLGKMLNNIAAWLFGVGKYLSPLVLVGMGIILVLRKETMFYVSKIAGLFVSFISILGLVHIYSYETSELFQAAKAGEGGGFFGLAIGYAMMKMTGFAGASIILIGLLLIGVTIAFNFSIVSLVITFFTQHASRMKNIMKNEQDSQDQEDLPAEPFEDPVVEQKPEKEEKIEFVRDPYENEEDEKEKRMEKVIKKAVSWMPSKKNKKSENQFLAWEFPAIDLLDTYTGKAAGGDVKKNVKIIQDTFMHFGIDVEPAEIKTGPNVTQYSFRPAVGVKLTRITSLSNDLALALAMHPIRIEAPIPGKSLIGIEVPNKSVAMVRLPELFQTVEFVNRSTNLLLALGKDVSGNFIFGDLKKMPHLLIAGSTGSGKSVCVNSILISMLYQNSPEDLKLILVDPKRVELSLYNGIPHLLADVIVENGKVLNALKWAIGEMERRYKMLQQVGSKDIISYNKKAESGESFERVNQDTGEIIDDVVEKIPYIVIVIDELADLMASHGKEVEGAIVRLAQMARAVGIHLIVSTQRPSVEVITGLIKANIPTRIAFNVASQFDSRTILDSGGAEKLLRNGDMLFSSAVSPGLRRLQGVYVSEEDVTKVVEFIKKQKFEKIEDDLSTDDIALDDGIEYDRHGNGPAIITHSADKIDFGSLVDGNDNDEPLYEEAQKTVIQCGKASTSLLQRKLRLGYSRAARLIDLLEERGVVGPADGAKPREVLVGNPNETHCEDPIEDQAIRDKWQI